MGFVVNKRRSKSSGPAPEPAPYPWTLIETVTGGNTTVSLSIPSGMTELLAVSDSRASMLFILDADTTINYSAYRRRIYNTYTGVGYRYGASLRYYSSSSSYSLTVNCYKSTDVSTEVRNPDAVTKIYVR